ncbi:MAG: pyridoxine 5'-phosphate synthase [Deltaproteobacteria bacterium]|nr:MAG: pyridoxine 5'-phosphate synthase [Deltaproteobacteria bacterium]
MPVRLHVNVDHIATLRNARGTPYPDPIYAAQICESAGADGITAHLREDRRHIRDGDVDRLKAIIQTPLNLEMAATGEMIKIAAKVKPAVITLVPERREERTTEGGLDVVGQRGAITEACAMAKERGIKTSLFIAADTHMVEAAHDLGVDQIELHTGEYCHDPSTPELERLRKAAALAAKLGLQVAAGHGLTRHNTVAVAAIAQVEELNIGHAIISDAVLVGLSRAVRDYRAAIDRGVQMRG